VRGLRAGFRIRGAAIGVLGGVRPGAGAQRCSFAGALAKEPAKRAGQFGLLLLVRRIVGGRGGGCLLLDAGADADVVSGGVGRGADYFRRLVRARGWENDFVVETSSTRVCQHERPFGGVQPPPLAGRQVGCRKVADSHPQ
jgi:hypothetical protein